MNVTITINCENAAFGLHPEHEVGRILKDLATKVFQRGVEDMPCMDENGNKVGWLRPSEGSLSQLIDFIKEKAEAGKIEWDDDAPVFWGLVEELG